LSHFFPFEFNFSTFFPFFLLYSLTSSVTQFCELVVLEVVHQEVIWLTIFGFYFGLENYLTRRERRIKEKHFYITSP